MPSDERSAEPLSDEIITEFNRFFKRAREFVEAADETDTLQTLFRTFVLNCAIRNGDAHLKRQVMGPKKPTKERSLSRPRL